MKEVFDSSNECICRWVLRNPPLKPGEIDWFYGKPNMKEVSDSSSWKENTRELHLCSANPWLAISCLWSSIVPNYSFCRYAVRPTARNVGMHGHAHSQQLDFTLACVYLCCMLAKLVQLGHQIPSFMFW